MPRPFIVINHKKLNKMYASGKSTNQIAKEFGVDWHVVKRNLSEAGITLRSPAESIAGYYKNNVAARKLITGRPRTYPCNETFFGKLTPDVAYILGFIQADGSVYPGHLSITLKYGDVKHLENIVKVMGADRPIRRQKNKLSAIPAAYLCISSTRLAGTLINKWGIRSPKSFTASTPKKLLYDRDYWRGVIDGNGTLCIATASGYHILKLVGALPLCSQFKDFCNSYGCGLNCTVHPHKSIFSFGMGRKEALTMAEVLYNNCGLALKRKQDIYLDWVKDEN